MLYQANFCNHCGEEIEKINKRFWQISRFCDICKTNFRSIDWSPKIGALIAMILGLWGFGNYLKQPEKSLNISSNQFSVVANSKTSEKQSQTANIAKIQNSITPQSNKKTENLNSTLIKPLQNSQSSKIENKESLQITGEEPVFYCGAQTKKGHPCTRKVKGGGRCWQHEGLPAIVAKEKLVASQ